MSVLIACHGAARLWADRETTVIRAAFVSLLSFLLDADRAAFRGERNAKLAATAVSPISLLNHPPGERERAREEELQSNSALRTQTTVEKCVLINQQKARPDFLLYLLQNHNHRIICE